MCITVSSLFVHSILEDTISSFFLLWIYLVLSRNMYTLILLWIYWSSYIDLCSLRYSYLALYYIYNIYLISSSSSSSSSSFSIINISTDLVFWSRAWNTVAVVAVVITPSKLSRNFLTVLHVGYVIDQANQLMLSIKLISFCPYSFLSIVCLKL